MCGRYSLHELEELERYRELRARLDELFRSGWKASYNIAPGADVPVVRLDRDGEFDGKLMRWGLIPFWSKDEKIGYKTINARAETLSEKASFREAFKRRRCLIPASGFYEWRRTNRPKKQPHFIHLTDHAPMVFAGLWEGWKNPEGERIRSCSIVTVKPNDKVATLHDRMPAILAPNNFEPWLHGTTTEAADLLHPYPADGMDMYPVSTLVNKADFDDPQCVERIDLVEDDDRVSSEVIAQRELF